ncbi:tubulin-like doman-containing protein [Treponema bryantii]|uniref:tubulin-like doman-containing protein n=1 Tax=Treponema bryantii TaxID=163 RepID=UPI0003B4B7CE|nr:tubulin-like doman-containing protein [Treponema bryantii]
MAEMYQPTLVIGLGGTGKTIILALKKMIAENCEHGMADFPFLELLSLDTDEAISNEKSLIKTIKEEELTLNRNQEVFKLHTNFGNVPNLEEYPEIHEWFPDSLRSHLTPAALAIGASQKKPVGRFTFAWNAKDLYERINKFMSAPVDAIVAKGKIVSDKLSRNLNVFICGSICGGTGAGTFLDVAYLVRYIAGLNNGNGFTVRIFGMLALASLFDGVKGTEKVRRNCYASLVELDHFMNNINFENPYRCFYPSYRNFTNDYGISSRNKPFDHAFLFDKSGNGFALPGVPAFGEMAARFIYLLTTHELSKHWFGMESNLDAPKDSKVNKSTEYYGMGTFSVLYPKRMIVQLCAYNLTNEYLKIILDDSYNPQEIEQLSKNFLKEIKLNPLTNQLEDAFDIFNEPNGFKGSFKDYIENAISNFEEQNEDTDKKDIKDELLRWKKEIEEKIIEFRNQNSSRAEHIRESFISQLSKQLELLLDLHEQKLGIKKNSDGTDLTDRGSLVRTLNFIDSLIKLFNESKDKYRKIRNEAESTIRNLNDDFETAISDFDETVDGIFANKKKIGNARDNVLDVCRNLFNAHRQNYIADWCYQLFTDILWNDVPKYDGLLKELESLKKKYQRILNSFNELTKEIEIFVESNKTYKSNIFFDALFDYEKDVVGTYKQLMEEQTESHVWNELSDLLTSKECFGKDYLLAANFTTTIINVDILRAAESFFFPIANKVNIEQRVLEDKDVCARLASGQYFDLTSVYLGLDQSGVLSEIGRDLKNSTFFSISIPDEYKGRECEHIKGDEGVGKKCPMEENPEKYTGEKHCNRDGKCLKQFLLKSQNTKVAITPTSEKSEINIIHTIKGYPLRAISSVMSNCKPEYIEAKAKLQKENEENGTNYEEINMFGPLVFDALDEKSIDPRKQFNDFRKLLLVSYIAKRLIVQPLSVDFVTERDLMQERKDKPSLHLGNTMNEVMVRFQSSRLTDKKDITQFEKEVNHLIEELKSREETKTKFGNRAKEIYETIKNDLPAGFLQDDLDLMNEIVKEITGIVLIPPTKLDSLML